MYCWKITTASAKPVVLRIDVPARNHQIFAVMFVNVSPV
jgi:hypothetical protein